ncbi:hypothetical protein JZ751_004426 [Albula glossodonta]|uniref:Uncharacterized protein n=1 Tax=Albula glossodonta TaxID=121402 RepID=A0A8T2NCU9_9TELE|nr:hypothetical protein JZ751_004426 [Albula glossodonta]
MCAGVEDLIQGYGARRCVCCALKIRQGENLQGKITVCKNRKDPRALLVSLTIRDVKQTYSIQ